MLASLLALSALVSVVSAVPQPIQKRAIQVINNCAVEGTAAITFDDGPYNARIMPSLECCLTARTNPGGNARLTFSFPAFPPLPCHVRREQYESILNDEFNNAGAKATFFLNGNNYQWSVLCLSGRREEEGRRTREADKVAPCGCLQYLRPGRRDQGSPRRGAHFGQSLVVTSQPGYSVCLRRPTVPIAPERSLTPRRVPPSAALGIRSTTRCTRSRRHSSRSLDFVLDTAVLPMEPITTSSSLRSTTEGTRVRLSSCIEYVLESERWLTRHLLFSRFVEVFLWNQE